VRLQQTTFCRFSILWFSYLPPIFLTHWLSFQSVATGWRALSPTAVENPPTRCLGLMTCFEVFTFDSTPPIVVLVFFPPPQIRAPTAGPAFSCFSFLDVELLPPSLWDGCAQLRPPPPHFFCSTSCTLNFLTPQLSFDFPPPLFWQTSFFSCFSHVLFLTASLILIMTCDYSFRDSPRTSEFLPRPFRSSLLRGVHYAPDPVATFFIQPLFG